MTQAFTSQPLQVKLLDPRFGDSWPLPANPRGHLEFFVERLVQHPATGSAV